MPSAALAELVRLPGSSPRPIPQRVDRRSTPSHWASALSPSRPNHCAYCSAPLSPIRERPARRGRRPRPGSLPASVDCRPRASAVVAGARAGARHLGISRESIATAGREGGKRRRRMSLAVSRSHSGARAESDSIAAHGRKRSIQRHDPGRARRAAGAAGQTDRGDRRGGRAAAGRRPGARRRRRGQAGARVHDRRPGPRALGADPAGDRLDPRRQGPRLRRPHDADAPRRQDSRSRTSTR